MNNPERDILCLAVGDAVVLRTRLTVVGLISDPEPGDVGHVVHVMPVYRSAIYRYNVRFVRLPDYVFTVKLDEIEHIKP